MPNTTLDRDKAVVLRVYPKACWCWSCGAIHSDGTGNDVGASEPLVNTLENESAAWRDAASKLIQEPAENGPYATTFELAKALGATDAEARRIHARVEKAAGGKPRLVQP